MAREVRVNTADIRELTTTRSVEQISQAKEELFRLRFRGATQQLENPALIKGLRRDIARMKTILRERELSHG
jgi:large subunit ribosomal protein L29